jgi:hypothetical protein
VAKKDSAIKLAFATRRCNCGGTRLAANSCPECGAKPRTGEVDVPLQRRQRLRTAFLRRRIPTEPKETDFFDILDRAGKVADPLLKQLAIVAVADQEHLDALLSAALAVDQLVADSPPTQPRPWTRPGRLLHEGGSRLSTGLYGFVDAMAASTLLDAQRIQAEAQAQLDAAASSATALDRSVSELRKLFELSSGKFVEALAERVHGMVATVSPDGEMSLLETDRAAAERVRQIVGDEHVVEGVGLGVLWMTALAEVIYDYDEFLSTASGTYALLRDSTRFQELPLMDEWQQNATRARRSMVDASTALDAMLAAARHETAQARGMLLFAQDMTEGAGKHYLATLVAITGRKSYSSLVGSDAGALLNTARQHASLRQIVRGIDPALRRASAHLDFEVRQNAVVLQPGPHERLPAWRVLKK